MNTAIIALIGYICVGWLVIGIGTLIIIRPMLHMAHKNTIKGE